MIYCPECGTANRDGSNFCNNCGKRLTPDGQVRCPMCDAPNSPGVEICQKCGARLKPLRLPQSGPEATLPATEPAPLIPPEAAPSEPTVSEAQPTSAPAEAPPELPDWLQRLRATAFQEEEAAKEIPAAAPAPEQAEGELPDWLREIVSPEKVGEMPAAEAGPTSEEEIPAWLHEIVTPEEAAAEPTAPVERPTTAQAAPEKAEPSLPAWLLAAEGAEEKLPEAEEGQPQTPQGLGALPDIGAETPVKSQREAPPSSEESAAAPLRPQDFIMEPAIPDWLREAAESPAAMQPVEEGEEEEIPDWLRSLTAPEVSQEKLGEERRVGPPTTEAEQPLEPVPSAGPAVFQEGEKPLVKPEIPDWLKELAPSGLPEEVPVTEQAAPALAKAEIPDWLESLRPSKAEEAQPEEDKLVEGSGLLAGIRGILPVESIWYLPRRAQATPIAPPPVAGTGPVELFADILVAHPEKRVVGAFKPAVAIPGGITRFLIYLLLAVVTIAPLFFGTEWFSKSIYVSQSTWHLFDAANRLPSGSVVVLSFDYDPAAAVELDLQAKAILRHLLARKVAVIAVSQVPQGPALAQDVWRQVARGREYLYGQDFINLGYLAGQEAGLRLFVQNLGGAFTQDFVDHKPLSAHALMRKVKDFREIALVVVLTGDQQDVRRWLEQVQSLHPVKMAAAVTALASPSVLPYYQSRQLSGFIAGLPGAAEYETAMNRPANAVSSLGAQTAAHLAIILVIILGNLASLVKGTGRRE